MPESLQRLLAELKRRRVLRVAGVYALVAWAIIQVSDIVFPALGLPAWTVTLVIVLVGLGFPAALALAWAFDMTPEGVRRAVAPAPVEAIDSAPGARAPRRMVRRGMWFALGILVAGSGAWIAVHQRERAALDANMVAVLPFRVTGDAELAYLRTGMLDLLAAMLTGEGGPRSSDPRSLLAAWKRAIPSEDQDLPEDAAIDFARGIGAGQLLLGSIVGTAREFTLTAKVLSVPGGRVRAEGRVQGSEQELTSLIEKLSAQLLTGLAGESDLERVNSLAGTPLPVLREYLAGRAAYRSGHYDSAAEHYRNVLLQDSTFAMAAFELSQVYGWNGDNFAERQKMNRLAYASRDRLSKRDLKLLMARLGPKYPERSKPAEHLKAVEEAVAAAPDRPEAWYELGDYLYHYGRPTNPGDYRELARRALERSVALDSSFAGPMIHLAEIANFEMDRNRVRAIAEAALRADSTSEVAQYMRWYWARTGGTRADRERVRRDFPAMKSNMVGWIAREASAQPWDTLDVNDAQLAEEARLARASSSSARMGASWSSGWLMFELGRPNAALQHLSQANSAANPRTALIDLIYYAMLTKWNADGAEDAARELAPFVLGPVPTDSAERVTWISAASTYEMWQLANGRTESALQTLAKIRRLRAELTDEIAWHDFIIIQLEAMLATAAEEVDALEEARRYNRFLIENGGGGMYNRIAAHLLEVNGDLTAALAVLKHETHDVQATLEYARLAARLGQPDEATRAYQKYLLLRHNPEPSMQPEVDRVRAELAALVGE